MAELFQTLKRVLTGKVVQKVDTSIMNRRGNMSLRLKYDSGNNEYYVVLAGLASGNYQYFAFEIDEFDRFLAAGKAIRANPCLQENPAQKV